MKWPAQLAIILVLVTGGIAAGYYLGQTGGQAPGQPANSRTNGAQQAYRPDFSLPDLEGTQHSIDEWNGQVIMLNFWATWCPPCRREMPAFIRLYDKYKESGFVILGIAIDDAQSVRDFVDPMGVDYPVLLGEEAGIDIATAYGNRLGALPFTVIIDREGHIIHTRPRELRFEEAEALIKPLL